MLKQMIIAGPDHAINKMAWALYEEIKKWRKVEKQIESVRFQVMPNQVNFYIDFVQDDPA